jgi:galactose mutarotase-like enzyme
MTKISNAYLSVDIASRGAELQSIGDAEGRSWLWNGDPDYWSGRAPLLFPIIGRSPNGQALIAGHRYPMGSHGFARTSDFELAASSAESCTFRLVDDAMTRTSFPFAFILDVTYTLNGRTLSTIVEVTNRDSCKMPFCIGFHPAVHWPLPGSNGQHVVKLDIGGEPDFCRIGTDGLLTSFRHPSPFVDGTLALDHLLFEKDALIFDSGIGSSLWFGVEGTPGIRVDYEGVPNLGIWTKPNAPFLCIEPWHGLPAPEDNDQSLEQRLGAIILEAGKTASLSMNLTFGVGENRC